MKLWDLLRELKGLDSHVEKEVKLLFWNDNHRPFKVECTDFVITKGRLPGDKDVIYIRAIQVKEETKDE